MKGLGPHGGGSEQSWLCRATVASTVGDRQKAGAHRGPLRPSQSGLNRPPPLVPGKQPGWTFRSRLQQCVAEDGTHRQSGPGAWVRLWSIGREEARGQAAGKAGLPGCWGGGLELEGRSSALGDHGAIVRLGGGVTGRRGDLGGGSTLH